MIKKLLKKQHDIFITIVILAAFSNSATAEDWSKLSKKKQTTLGLYMTSTQAYDYMMKNGEHPELRGCFEAFYDKVETGDIPAPPGLVKRWGEVERQWIIKKKAFQEKLARNY